MSQPFLVLHKLAFVATYTGRQLIGFEAVLKAILTAPITGFAMRCGSRKTDEMHPFPLEGIARMTPMLLDIGGETNMLRIQGRALVSSALLGRRGSGLNPIIHGSEWILAASSAWGTQHVTSELTALTVARDQNGLQPVKVGHVTQGRHADS